MKGTILYIILLIGMNLNLNAEELTCVEKEYKPTNFNPYFNTIKLTISNDKEFMHWVTGLHIRHVSFEKKSKDGKILYYKGHFYSSPALPNAPVEVMLSKDYLTLYINDHYLGKEYYNCYPKSENIINKLLNERKQLEEEYKQKQKEWQESYFLKQIEKDK